MNCANEITAKKEEKKETNFETREYKDINTELDNILNNSSFPQELFNIKKNTNQKNELNLEKNKIHENYQNELKNEEKDYCNRRLSLKKLIDDDSLHKFFNYCPQNFKHINSKAFYQNFTYGHCFIDSYKEEYESIFQLIKAKKIEEFNLLKNTKINMIFGVEPSSLFKDLKKSQKKEKESKINKFFNYIDHLDIFRLKNLNNPCLNERFIKENEMNNFVNKKTVATEEKKIYESSSSLNSMNPKNQIQFKIDKIDNISKPTSPIQNTNVLIKPIFYQPHTNVPDIIQNNKINNEQVRMEHIICKIKKEKKKIIKKCHKKLKKRKNEEKDRKNYGGKSE